MIFGRKNKDVEPVVDEAELDEELLNDEELDDDELDEDYEDDELDDEEVGDEELDHDLDEWEALDASRDWREDGPFDISEVDLDADDVERLDFGCVVLTPFEGMQMQLQVDQRSQKVQAALVMAGKSAIEIALFAAPAQSSMVAEIRDEMLAATEKSGGQATLAEGPFGTEVRRVVPMTDPKGNVRVSRAYLAHLVRRGSALAIARRRDGRGRPGEWCRRRFGTHLRVLQQHCGAPGPAATRPGRPDPDDAAELAGRVRTPGLCHPRCLTRLAHCAAGDGSLRRTRNWWTTSWPARPPWRVPPRSAS